MIRSLYRTADGRTRTDLSPEELPDAFGDKEGLLWVDLADEPPQACEPLLRDVFGFHQLAVDDALKESHVPKVDDWGQYLYLVLHAVDFQKEGGRLVTGELDVFLTRNALVTYHDRPFPAVDRTWSSCPRDERRLKGGASRLLYELADEMASGYMPVVEEMVEASDEMEDLIFENSSSSTLAKIFALKRAVLHLHRIMSPQREVLNKLARDDYEVIDPKTQVYFRDVYDHYVRLHDINDTLRDLVGGAIDTYLSVVNNRMNDIMKTLTVITTLFMPVSFLAGFFGMNFFQPARSGVTGPVGMVATTGAMLVVPVLMYFWMRRRGWM